MLIACICSGSCQSDRKYRRYFKKTITGKMADCLNYSQQMHILLKKNKTQPTPLRQTSPPSLGRLFQCFIILAIRQIILIASPRVQFDVTHNPTPPCHVCPAVFSPSKTAAMQPASKYLQVDLMENQTSDKHPLSIPPPSRYFSQTCL